MLPAFHGTPSSDWEEVVRVALQIDQCFSRATSRKRYLEGHSVRGLVRALALIYSSSSLISYDHLDRLQTEPDESIKYGEKAAFVTVAGP
jgi:hypothetical protein